MGQFALDFFYKKTLHHTTTNTAVRLFGFWWLYDEHHASAESPVEHLYFRLKNMS